MAEYSLKKYALLFLTGIISLIFLLKFSALINIFILLVIFLFVTTSVDGDLSLLFYEKFGTDPRHMKGKVIWITGASSGLGEGIAFSFARVNCRLIISARTKDKLEDVKKRCLECSNLMPEDILVLPFDMLDYRRHEEVVKTAIGHFGQIDILISNAGRSQRARWEMIDIDVDKHLFELNVFSLLSLARLVTKHFLSIGKGHHVLTTSVASLIGVPGSASYTGAKHAIRGYFESLRMEKSSEGVSVTILCPGPTQSNLMESCFGEKADVNGFPARTGKLMPSERFSQLTLVAVANRLSEAWICQQPVIMMMYLYQYTPSFIKWLVSSTNFFGLAMKLRDGRSSTSTHHD